MSGFGTAPMGSAPFGYGYGDEGVEPPDGAAGSRYINPASGQYEQDPGTRQLKQMPALRQRVLLKLRTIKGSSTVLPNLGIVLPRKIDQTFDAKVASGLRVAFRQETDVEKIMRIDGIAVRRLNTGRVEITLSYTDLTTGEADSVTA